MNKIKEDIIMKKVLAVLMAVCVMTAAGTALANQKANDNRQPPMPMRMEQHHRPQGHTFTPDMPKEIREKAAELAKLRVDLEEALTSRPVNKDKALEVHAKMQTLKNEIDNWKFSKKLERIEARQKEAEKFMKALPPHLQNEKETAE